MTLPDPTLDRPGGDDQGRIDRLPPNQRGQDELRTEVSHGLSVDGSRPLTSEEKEAAAHDTGIAERVYAPASERVPVPPVPGHRDFVEHTDEATPERQAAHVGQPTATAESGEPAFTRVERPSQQREWTPSPMSTPYSSPYSNPTFNTEPGTGNSRRLGLPIGIGSMAMIACGAIGVWLYMRWQRERNKPINRFRRQALQAANELRDHVPDVDELRQPAGYSAAASLLPIGLVMWRMLQSRDKRPLDRVTEADWQARLMSLKERWSPMRLELEKTSISRH